MKISKLFHYLYLSVLILPFVALIFNLIRFGFSGTQEITSFNDCVTLITFPTFSVASESVKQVFTYLVVNMFGFSGLVSTTLINAMTYWCCVSIIWLVFDVVMYVPLLVHRWLDKGGIE